MQHKAFRIFLFLVVNIGLVLFHLWVFKGPYPMMAWVSALVHIGFLLMFPYKKLLRL